MMKTISYPRLHIPIVFAANDKYAPMLGVTIHSLIKYADPNRNYRLMVLTEDISEGHWKRICGLAREHVSIERVDVSRHMKEKKIRTVEHLSKETTYRLLVDQLFPEYDKLLYLDCDIVIRKDISKLWDVDLDDCIVGASRAKIFGFSDKYTKEELHIKTEDYFNAGILLINLPRFHQQSVGDVGLRMLEEKRYLCQDQDVLNILCQNQVKFIDGHWNVEWQHLTPEGKDMILDETRKDVLSYEKDPYIVHYTTRFKPWNHPEIELAEYFWAEAKETVFYEELLQIGAVNRMMERLEEPIEAFRRYCFPWKYVQPESAIIVYGAGAVGRAFLKQLETTQYCRVICVCDKNAGAIHDIALPVVSCEELSNFHDYPILIAIEKEAVAMEVKKELLAQGISADRLIWSVYTP